MNNGVESAVGPVVLTVVSELDPPVAVADAYALDEDTYLGVAAPGLLGNDTLTEGRPATITVTRPPAHGSVQALASGAFGYAPDDDFNGEDSFEYVLNNGAVSQPAVVTLTVRPTTDYPEVGDDAYKVAEDGVLTVAAPGVRGNDDLPADETAVLILTQPPAHGELTINQDGSFTYTPAADFNGDDSFEYKLDSGLESNPATVTLTVTPANDAPTAAPEAYATTAAAPLVVSAAAGVLANDEDIDGDALSAVLVAQPASGSVTLNADGSFRYTPAADTVGDVSFRYQATDGRASSPVQTVTITRRPFAEVVGTRLMIVGSAFADTVRLRPAGGAAVAVELRTPAGLLTKTVRPVGGPAFTLISVSLGAGDDSYDAAAVGRPTRLLGGAGADLLRTGGGADVVYGDEADGLGGGADIISTCSPAASGPTRSSAGPATTSCSTAGPPSSTR